MDDIDDIFVAQLMSSDVHTVTPETLVEEAARVLLDNDIGSVVVVDEDEKLEGILTTTDFVKIVAERKPKDETPVSAYASVDVTTAAAGDSIRNVADRLVELGIHHMPVVEDDGTVIGMITTTDLTSYISTVQTPSPA